MHIIRSPQHMNRAIQRLKQKGKSIGFVPTMGALHEGHASLLRRARHDHDICVLSIFVNPKQFGPKEDFKKYPRPEKADTALAKKEGVDIIFYPSAKDMYPPEFLTAVEVSGLSSALCGEFRPGHFRGVTTVVAKLLNIVSPDEMYLGQKDAQQAVIIKRMVADLNFATTISVCPTIREKDGLALSSRNRFLTSAQRNEAANIYRSLKHAVKRINEGERDAAAITKDIRSILRQQTSGRIDYVACVDARTLAPLKKIRGKALIALAVRFAGTRLIDNMIVDVR